MTTTVTTAQKRGECRPVIMNPEVSCCLDHWLRRVGDGEESEAEEETVEKHSVLIAFLTTVILQTVLCLSQEDVSGLGDLDL